MSIDALRRHLQVRRQNRLLHRLHAHARRMQDQEEDEGQTSREIIEDRPRRERKLKK
jgi:hypothetical protein